LWANITHTCHCIDAAHDQVIFHDNDFEVRSLQPLSGAARHSLLLKVQVFVDADGSNSFYKEFEMNAANSVPNSATWVLCLNVPYDDNGYENSSRVLGAKGFDMQPPLLAASWSDGELNNPFRLATRWTAEIRFPLLQLAANTSASVPPRDGDIWRINFSRVEWGVMVVGGRYEKRPSCLSCPVPGSSAEDNWVWSPQGVIAMHRPERWGMLHFSSSVSPLPSPPPRNIEWTVRSLAMILYFAQVVWMLLNLQRLMLTFVPSTHSSRLAAVSQMTFRRCAANYCCTIAVCASCFFDTLEVDASPLMSSAVVAFSRRPECVDLRQ
jgi:hypothetical protein